MVITNTCPYICKQSTDILKCLTKQHSQTALYLLSRAHQRMTNQKPRKAETAVDLLSKSAGWHLLQSPSAVNLSQTTKTCHLSVFSSLDGHHFDVPTAESKKPFQITANLFTLLFSLQSCKAVFLHLFFFSAVWEIFVICAITQSHSSFIINS